MQKLKYFSMQHKSSALRLGEIIFLRVQVCSSYPEVPGHCLFTLARGLSSRSMGQCIEGPGNTEMGAGILESSIIIYILI
jgi:hypothetical protein